MKRMVVAQIGARMHYAAPRIFYRAGSLERLYTDFAAPRWAAGFGRMGTRRPSDVPARLIAQAPWIGIAAAVRNRLARSEREHLRLWIAMGRRFCEWVARRGFGEGEAVYGFNSASLEMFAAARERGVRRVLEQTIAPKRIETRLLAEERAAWPGWEEGCDAGECAAEFAAREAAEWGAADTIVCGSEFVKTAIAAAGGPVERCRVVPYGVDLPLVANRIARDRGKLRVLFSGAVGLRKGVPYLMAAARRFPLRLVGRLDVPPAVRRDLERRCEVTGAVSRPSMAEQYRWADVFVLPSICEGSATVCYEALAAGLPVITTPNAGSVVRDGIEGFIVPVRDANAIAEKLELLASDPGRRAAMSRAAAERAREFTLERYGQRLLAALTV